MRRITLFLLLVAVAGAVEMWFRPPDLRRAVAADVTDEYVVILPINVSKPVLRNIIVVLDLQERCGVARAGVTKHRTILRIECEGNVTAVEVGRFFWAYDYHAYPSPLSSFS